MRQYDRNRVLLEAKHHRSEEVTNIQEIRD